MPADNSSLGRCPNCGREITPANLLIEYETDEDEHAAFAECPQCNEIVSPE